MKHPTSKCRGCGRNIIWVVTSSGARHPLDAVAPVFELTVSKVDGREQGVWARAENAFVSHFVTCSKRDEFKPKKAAP